MKIKAVLFDMDGVLIEAKDWHYEALNHALCQFGMEITREQHLSTYDGLPTKRKLELLSEQYYIPKKLRPLINDLKQEYTFDEVEKKCFPVYQHEYLLARLKQEGYQIAVCSNSIRRSIEYMMEKSHLMPHLDLILSNEDVKKNKPDPEIYQTAMQRFGVRPEECLILEDNVNGIRAAQASGGHLLQIGTVWDVSYKNVRNRIREIEEGEA